MASFIELIAKIKQKNNGDYPLVDAEDIECEDGKRLNVVLNEKLDKNQGVENAGKTMIVGDDGNLVVGDSSPKNVYTKEEVDYLLADKMDKPYVPIEITDNATITDALEGNFKIDKIKGNTYQNVETDIVPTPDRPVPINSRKVLANGDCVELRSLKETGNLFDLKYGQLLFGEKVGSTTNNGSGVIIENQYAITVNLAVVYLKANTNYCFKSNRAKEPIEGMEESGNDLNMLGVLKGSTPIIQVISGNTFTVNDSGYYYLRLYGTVGCKVSYTSIMLVEGTSAPSTYVPPTIRDYKIVDHANKTSKIIRNVRQRLLTAKDGFYKSGYGGMEISLRDAKPLKMNETTTSFCNLFNHNISNTIPNNLCYRLDNNYLQFNYEGYNDKTLWDKFITDNELYIQYQLANPTEEEITYVEDYTSEVGCSWQDTTSPSPTIKSEIKGVEEIDILKTGKNLFDVESAKDRSNWIPSIRQVGYIDFMIKVIKGKQYTFSYRDKLDLGLNFYAGIVNEEDITNNIPTHWIYHSTSTSLINNHVTFISKGDHISLRVNNGGFDHIFEHLQDMQLELGDTRTTYEPYKGQHINIALPQPLYENDVANIESGEYEYEKQKYVVTGDEIFINDYQSQAGYYGRYFNLENGNGVYFEKTIWCNYLSYIPSSWNLASEGVCQNENTQIHLKFSNDRLGIKDDTPVEEKRLAFANYLKQLYASGDPLYVVVKVAKTTQPIPEEDLAKIKSLKTNAGVNNIFVGGEIKPSIEARYPQDVVSAVNTLQTRLLTLQEEVIKNV